MQSLSPQARYRTERMVSRRPRGRVLLIGGDSIISQTIQLYLRHQGFDVTVVTGEPDGWLAALPVTNAGAQPPAVIVVSSMTGAQREQLCSRIRQLPSLHSVPILALLEAGDTTGGSVGVVRGAQPMPPAAGSSDAGESPEEHAASQLHGVNPAYVDATLSWPFRLREVLVRVEDLVQSRMQPASA